MEPPASGSLAELLALTAAVASAATFGLSTSLQHRVAGATNAVADSGAMLLARLVRRPSWVVGLALSVVAFCLHALAIAFGALALVQPVIVSGIVFSVLIRSGLDRRAPSRREVAWAAVTWAGLALFIATTSPGPARVMPDNGAAVVFALAALVAAGAAAHIASVASTQERRGLWLGIAAGVLFGLVAGLLKIVTALAVSAPVQVVLQWPAWVMIAAGLWAMTMNQRAYQATRLSVSMPILNIVDVIVALGFGASVFGERLGSSPDALVAQVLGLCVMGLGVRQLARREEQVDPTQPLTRGGERASAIDVFQE